MEKSRICANCIAACRAYTNQYWALILGFQLGPNANHALRMNLANATWGDVHDLGNVPIGKVFLLVKTEY